MSDEESNDSNTLIIATADHLLDAARRAAERVKAKGGNVTPDDVIEEIAKGLGGSRESWGNIKRQEVYQSFGMPPLEKLLGAAGTGNVSRADSGKSRRCDQNEEFQDPNFELVKPKEELTGPRMLLLAGLWQQGEYENRHEEDVACRMFGVDIYEYELVLLAELIRTHVTGSRPFYMDSAYRLLENWSHSKHGVTGASIEDPESLLRHLLFGISYAPASELNQAELALEVWPALKFNIDMDIAPEIWLMLAEELGWRPYLARIDIVSPAGKR